MIAELAEEWHGAELRQKVAQARTEAQAEARAEATVKAKADAVLRALRNRLEYVQTDVEEALYAERDLERLNQWMDAAATCADLAEFRARLWPN